MEVHRRRQPADGRSRPAMRKLDDRQPAQRCGLVDHQRTGAAERRLDTHDRSAQVNHRDAMPRGPQGVRQVLVRMAQRRGVGREEREDRAPGECILAAHDRCSHAVHGRDVARLVRPGNDGLAGVRKHLGELVDRRQVCATVTDQAEAHHVVDVGQRVGHTCGHGRVATAGSAALATLRVDEVSAGEAGAEMNAIARHVHRVVAGAAPDGEGWRRGRNSIANEIARGCGPRRPSTDAPAAASRPRASAFATLTPMRSRHSSDARVSSRHCSSESTRRRGVPRSAKLAVITG